MIWEKTCKVTCISFLLVITGFLLNEIQFFFKWKFENFIHSQRETSYVGATVQNFSFKKILIICSLTHKKKRRTFHGDYRRDKKLFYSSRRRMRWNHHKFNDLETLWIVQQHYNGKSTTKVSSIRLQNDLLCAL